MKPRTHNLVRRVLYLVALGGIATGAWTAHGCLIGLSERVMHVMSERFGQMATTRLKEWQRNEQRIHVGVKDLQLLESVNTLANRIPYGTDQDIWGVEDYWATPAELVAVNAGDCEDYVIAKYFTLRAHGVSASQLRFVYVRALLRGRLGTHMVLAYYKTPDSEPLVLDNINHKLLPVSQRPDLMPVYSFNDENMYREGASGSRKVDSVSVVRRWGDLVARITKEKQL